MPHPFASDSASPLQFVKMLSFTLLLLILGSSLGLSMFISNYAEDALLEKQKQFALLLTENLSHQIYTRFTLPSLIGFGQISLANKEQYTRMDQVVRSTIHSFLVQEVRIYDLKNYQIVYSTNAELLAKTGLAGESVRKAFEEGKPRFEFMSQVPRFATYFFSDLAPGSMVLRGFAPLRAERSFVEGADNPIMGIVEFSQDVTQDYVNVLNFERLVILSSLVTSLVLFYVIMSVIRRAERLNRQRLAEKERLERELAQQEKLAGMGRMVAGVAHEIRNPLGIICSSAELILKKSRAENSQHTRILEALYGEARRLSRTVGDFLDYARPKQPRMDEVDLSRVVDQAVVFLEPEMEKCGVAVVRDYPPELKVRGDKDLLYRAVYNVMANAMQAMQAQGGGTIFISGARQDDGLRLTLRDSGPGFDPENMDKLKDPFFTTKEMGTGLGLAIVNSIIESHGAALTLLNDAEGGARVDMLFPPQ